MTNKILVPDARGLAEEHDAQSTVHHQPDGLFRSFRLGLHQIAAL